jgi:hypothetical protein
MFMTTNAKGPFEVKMTPQKWTESTEDHALGRFLLDKQYHGDLEASALGQMLSSGTGAKGSSGVYVAIEKVTGTLHGRTGTFVLYHTGVINRGVPQLSISVAPDSGTGDLTGLAGSMTIQIADGKHSYEFAYTLATVQ